MGPRRPLATTPRPTEYPSTLCMHDQPPKLSEDDRFDLAQRAMAASRRARPTLPLVIGSLALLIGVGVLLYASMARSDSIEDLGRQQRRLDRVVALEQSFAAIETRRQQGASGVQDPIPDLLSRLERAAEDAGLEKPSLPRDVSDEQQGVIDRRLQYTFRNVELEQLLEWIELATQRVRGLEVNDIRMVVTPSSSQEGDTSWVITVTLARWERAS